MVFEFIHWTNRNSNFHFREDCLEVTKQTFELNRIMTEEGMENRNFKDWSLQNQFWKEINQPVGIFQRFYP